MNDILDPHACGLLRSASVDTLPTKHPGSAENGDGLSAIVNVLQNFVEEARHMIGAHYGGIRITLDPQWKKVLSATSYSEERAEWRARTGAVNGTEVETLLYPIPRSLRMTQEEMIAHPAWKGINADDHHHLAPRGLLAVPLLDRDGQNFGLIDLTDKCLGDFTEKDEQRLVHLAQIAALALENAWLFQASSRPAPEKAPSQAAATLQREVGIALAQTPELRHAWQACTDAIARHMDQAAARIWIRHEGAMILHGSSGIPARHDGIDGRIPALLLKSSLAARPELPYLTGAILGALPHQEKEWAQRSGLTSYASLPLVVDDETEGVLAVFDRKEIAPSVLEALAAVAQAIALHIKRSRAISPSDSHATSTPPEVSHAVVVHRRDGVITDWNCAAERLFGYSQRQAVGQSIRMLVPPEHRGDHEEMMHKLCRNESSSRTETPRLTSGGKRIEVSLTMSPLGEAGAVLVAHDIAGAKRLEQQYRQAQKMEIFGHLTGGVAHDFNNLLTVILGYTELLIGRVPVNDPTRELLTEIHKAGIRAEHLTRQLLSFSRKQEVNLRVLDLNAVVSDTEKMLRH